MKKSAAKKATKKPAPKPPVKKTTAHPARQSRSATAATAVKSPASKPAQAPKLPEAKVCADHQRRTCILLERDADRAKYVALDVENGLDLAIAEPKHFDERFKPLVDYPVEKAAALYVEYARGLGATEQVMRLLGKLTPVTNEDIEMATKKKAARAASPVKTAKKTAAKKATTTAAKAAKKATGEKKERAPRGPTAASKFQELILQSKDGKTADLTDDQIFTKVQKEFGLDDSKRSYVKWYRNYLTKQGKNPPAPKE